MRIDRRTDEWTEGQIDRRTDITELTVVFRNFEKAPKNVSNKSCRENQSTKFMFKTFLTTIVPCMR